MKILDILLDVSQRAGQELDSEQKNGETLRTHLLRAFNMLYANINRRFIWPWNDKICTIQTVSNLTGTLLTVTNGSRTITDSSAPFTAAMVGRFLKLDRDNEIYQISAFVSTSEMTLVDPYIGASGSSLTYLVWKKFYLLPPDAPSALSVQMHQYPSNSHPINFSDDVGQFSNNYLTGFPSGWGYNGIERSVTSYSTGTVTATVSSRILTGSGTSFLGNVQSGGKITIGTTVYHVETVDSDTQITMVQKAVASFSAQTYTIEHSNMLKMCFNRVPDPAVNLYISYSKKTYPLYENDEMEIWDGFEINYSDILYAYVLEKLTDNKSINWRSIAEAQIKEMFRNTETMSPVTSAARMKSNELSWRGMQVFE